MNKTKVEGLVKFVKVHEFNKKDKDGNPRLHPNGAPMTIKKVNFLLDIVIGGRMEGFNCSSWDKDIVENLKNEMFIELESYLPRMNETENPLDLGKKRFYFLDVKEIVVLPTPANLVKTTNGGFRIMKAEDDIAKPTNLKWSKTSKDGLEYTEASFPKPKLPLDMSSFERKPFLNEVPVIEPVPVIENNIVNEAINNFEKQRDETVLDWEREIDEK